MGYWFGRALIIIFQAVLICGLAAIIVGAAIIAITVFVVACGAHAAWGMMVDRHHARHRL
jgi:hypothetical protein